MPEKEEEIDSTAVKNEEGDDDDVKKEEIDDENPKQQTGSKRKRKRKRKKKSTKDETVDDDDDDNNNNNEDDGGDHDHSASVDCTVYVEGIPFDSSPDDVKEFFESIGSITDILELRLPTWQDSGRLRGYGHVHFASKTSYDKALALSGKHMGRRYLTIQPSQAPKGHGGGSSSRNSHPDPNQPPPENCKTLFVNNLPYSALEPDVETAFGELCDGNLAEVRIARNSVNRQSKGFCYIEFSTPQDAQAVVKASFKKRITVGGRAVRIDYDTGRMKGSFRSESGRLWTKETKELQRQQQQGRGGGKRQRNM